MPLQRDLNKRFHFEGQDPDEEILFVIHRHWFNILVQFIPCVLGFLAVVGSFLFFIVLSPDALSFISRTLFFFIESLLLIFLWFFAFLIWINYYLDVWIITNKRIVNIEQKGLFIRSMSDVYLFRVQDVTTEVYGFFPSLLNFGNVYAQSAGERERFVFRKIPLPYDIKDTIMDLAQHTHQSEIESIKSVFNGSGTNKIADDTKHVNHPNKL